MAKSAKTRRSGTTRKKVSPAEPVDMENGAGTTRAAAQDTPPVEKKTDGTAAAKAAAPEHRVPMAQRRAGKYDSGYRSVLFAGAVGGIIALVASAILLKTGMLTPFAASSENVEILADAGLGNEVAELKKQLAALSSLQETAIPGQQEQAALAEARQNAARAAAIAADVEKQARSALEAVAGIRQELAADPDQTAIAGLQKAIMQRMSALESRFREFDELKQNMAAARSAAQDQESRLETLKKDMALLAEQRQKTDVGIRLLVAANALKAAVDRGVSYARELLAFEAVAPAGTSPDLLKIYADKGLPSATELSGRFAGIADRIARTENDVPADAGLGKKIWAGARALVTSRPVGNAEGTTPGAIAARMEMAIAAGDYAHALHEWQALSGQAKAVSADFMTTLEARYEVDSLLSRFMAMALSLRLGAE